MSDREDIPSGCWRSWPCSNCGECLDRGPVWEKQTDGWRCNTCGHWERDSRETDWVQVFLTCILVLTCVAIVLKALSLLRF